MANKMRYQVQGKFKSGRQVKFWVELEDRGGQQKTFNDLERILNGNIAHMDVYLLKEGVQEIEGEP